jgi:hypothetical protein
MVDSRKFVAAGFGPHKPHYDVATANNKNRRIELIITRNEFAPEDTPSMLDMLKYDYMFPVLSGGPLNGRQPCPASIDQNQQIYNHIVGRHGFTERELAQPPAPSPSDGRGFDFSVPTIPRG